MFAKNRFDKDNFYERLLPQRNPIAMRCYRPRRNEDKKRFRFWCLLVQIVLIVLIISIYISVQYIRNSTNNVVKDSEEKVGNGRPQNDSSRSSSFTTSKNVLRAYYENYRDKRSATDLLSNTTSEQRTLSPRSYYEEQEPVVVHAENGLAVDEKTREGLDEPNQTYKDSYYSDVLSDDRLSDYKDDDDTGDSYNSDDDGDANYDYTEQDEELPVDADLSDYKRKELTSQGRSKSDGSSYDSFIQRPWHYVTQSSSRADENEHSADEDFRNGNAYDDYGVAGDYDYPSMGSESHVYTKSQWNQPNQQKQKQQQQKQSFYKQEYHPHIPENSQGLATASPSTSSIAGPWHRQQQQPTTLLSVVKQLKTMWDLYKAFTAAWNALAEHSQKREEDKQQHQQQQQQQQKRKQDEEEKQAQIKQEKAKQQKKQISAQKQQDRTRSNTRRPSLAKATESQRRNNITRTTTDATATINKMTTMTTTKAKITTTKKKPTTKRKPEKTTTTTSTTILPMDIVSELPPAKVEPRTAVSERKDGEKIAQQINTTILERKKRQNSNEQQKQGQDQKRQTASAGNDSAIAEGRYIKGDPLKGYYDFVITEGSYKFWAVFQVGTAILVIYSTFAAIYYSKVNPLVSDYDYTDYLGGARSLSSSNDHNGNDENGDESTDMDFVDDDIDNNVDGSVRNGYQNSRWLSSMKHSLRFILDSIDSLPVDHGNEVGDKRKLV